MNEDKFKRSAEMLYKAYWNVPQAAAFCGVSSEKMKVLFTEWLLGEESLPKK